MSAKAASGRRRRQAGKSYEKPENLFKQWHIAEPYSLKQLPTDNTYKKIQHMLEGKKESNPEYFGYDECFNNMLVFLLLQRYKLHTIDTLPEVSKATKDYIVHISSHQTTSSGEDKDLGKVKSSNDDSKRSWNIFTLLNDWHILNHQNQRASDILKLLSDILDEKSGSEGDDWKFQARCIYEAELGYLHYELGRKHYREAAISYTYAMRWIFSKSEKLEYDIKSNFIHFNVDPDELFKVWSSIADGDCMKKKMILWCFQWAKLHSKLLLKYNIQTLKHFYEDMIDVVFRNTCNILLFVTKTGDKQFCGWAWAILGETVKNYQLLSYESGTAPVNKTPVECLQEARMLSPEHPDVLYLIGRHLRQRANSLKDFQEAVSCLEKAASICSSMHVVYHHLGLAYRSMWILDRNYPEAKFYNNYERRASSHRLVGRKGKNKKKWSSNCKLDGDQIENNVLKPKYPETYDSLPRHYKRPDYYNILRTSNPIERKQKEHEYLRKSYYYLSIATEKTHNTSTRYLTDLARVSISLRNDPEEYFTKAARAIEEDDQTSSTDGAYLFEQWGLYVKSRDPSRAKELFLKSLRFSVMGKQRSRVAFYELIDLLKKIEDQDLESKKAVAKEQAYIFRLVGKYVQAQDAIKAAACLAGSKQLNDIISQPENEELLWELICCYHGEGNNPVAFDYLMMYVKCFPEKPEHDKAKIALDIAVSLMTSKDNFSNEFPDVFRWVFSNHESDSDESSDEQWYDILLLANDLTCPLIAKVTDCLQSLCGLKHFEASDSSGDLLSIDADTIWEAFEWIYNNLHLFCLCLVEVGTDGSHESKEYKELLDGVKREAHVQGICLVMFTQDSQCKDAIYLSNDTTSDDILCRIIKKASQEEA